MRAAVTSELRKLLTVRATYFVVLISVLLEVLFAFYGDGIRANAAALERSGYLAGEITNAVSVVSVFIALAGVLLVANEYRHNTITYTLTASNSRTRVMFAKIFAVSLYAVSTTVILAFLSPVLTALGLHLAGHHYAAQNIPILGTIWRVAFYGWGFAMFGVLAAFLIRNQIGAIVALFVLPTTVEPLIGHLFSRTQNYLPFSSLNQVMTHSLPLAQSYGHAALLYLAYLAVALVVAWYLFIKRDAN